MFYDKLYKGLNQNATKLDVVNTAFFAHLWMGTTQISYTQNLIILEFYCFS